MHFFFSTSTGIYLWIYFFFPVSLFFFFCSPQIAVTLLVHKIHSPQEWEALQALTVRNAAQNRQQAHFLRTAKPTIHINVVWAGAGGVYEELRQTVSQ